MVNGIADSRMGGGVQRLFDHVLQDRVDPASRPNVAPAIDIREHDEQFVVEVDLPGVALDELDVTITGRELVIGGRWPDPATAATWHVRERRAGAFRRTIMLPVDIDRGNVQASADRGVVRITLPKAGSALPRKIDVQSS